MSEPRRRSRATMLAAAALLPAVLGGCGSTSGGNVDPATIVPAGAVVYGDAVARPSGQQQANAQAVLSRLLNAPNPGKMIADSLDARLKQSAKGVTYDRDIKPWLGRRIGFALTTAVAGATGAGSPFALFFDSRDDATARAFIDRTNSGPMRSYRSITYKLDGTTAVGVVHHVVVDAAEPTFRQVVDTATGGPSLAAAPAFARARSAAPSGGNALVNLTVNLGALANSPLVAQGSNAQTLAALQHNLDLSQPITASVDAQPQALTLDLTAKPSGAAGGGPSSGSATGALFDTLPATSWLALAVPHLGQTFAHALASLPGVARPQLTRAFAVLRQRTGLDVEHDVLPTLGDTALFASGTQVAGLATGASGPNDLSLGVVTTPTSVAAAQRTLSRVRALLLRQGRTTVTPAPGGFHASSKQNPTRPGVLVELRGNRVAVAVTQPTVDALLNPRPSGGLSSAAGFARARQALGADLRPSLYLAFPPIFQLAQLSSGTQSPGYQRAQPYLRHLSSLVIGSGRRAGLSVVRVVVGVGG